MADATGDWGLKWEMLVADTWDDPELKQRLLDDPASVLKERGIEIPEGVSINIVADKENETTLVLPTSGAGDDLSAAELDGVAGGTAQPAIKPKDLDGRIDKPPGR